MYRGWWRRNPTFQRGASQYRQSPSAEFRPVTIREAQGFKRREHFWIVGRDGKVYEVRVSGRPKLLKRTPDWVEVPFKYGLYEHGRITTHDIQAGRVLKEV